ncbi:MAG: polysaccharide deacetylase family protein [Bdellovibrionales bacterium]|nr:polysaccharide deacetylase family protein [Bdellovibrionales bacterium]
MILFRALLIFSIFVCLNSHAKEIAITFDDSPRHARGYLDGPTRSSKLIENLRSNNVGKVAFFSVSNQIDKEGEERLKKYSAAGHWIANHTSSHLNFNETSLLVYVEDFKQAHLVLGAFTTSKRWFRFPYLREGNSIEKRDGMRKALKQLDYRNGYITINNYDWYIEVIFQRELRNPNFDFERMKRFYVKVLMENIEFYDNMAIEYIGRSPKHVLLLHETDLSALYIGDLVQALRKANWRTISAENAYTDKIAEYETATVFSYNPGRIGEIARDKGKMNGLWHESCDEVYLEKRFKKEVLLQEYN